ncbi:MAG TPA: HDOD domain-containing protein [Gammaproteobacteria bacterium]|nr:HDOD domain-containing protein [Gammaproteobacteria bacterium]
MNKENLLQQEIQQDLNLPVLPSGISYLLRILNNDDIGYSELADKLEKFPSIALKIVAIANSAWAAPATPITSLRGACARVGVQVVRSISIALTVAQVFDPTRCPLFKAKTFWISALLTAESASICIQDNHNVCPDTARLAGLFHNIGLLWLATHKPLETGNAIAYRQKHPDSTLAEALTKQLGMDLYITGGYLASYIELPEVIATLIASPSLAAHDSDPLISNHRQAILLASLVLEAADNGGNIVVNDSDREHFEQLARKLPDIQSMAQALFFC